MLFESKQAKPIHEYKTTKGRLLKTIAAMWYNKTCKNRQISPNYISIKINGNNRQCTSTLKAATKYRINHEIKFLNVKKNKHQTFTMCLSVAQLLAYHTLHHWRHLKNRNGRTLRKTKQENRQTTGKAETNPTSRPKATRKTSIHAPSISPT